jgi:hypothetical protein
MWEKEVIKIGEPRQARLMSPHVFLTIPHKTTTFWIGHESICMSMNLSTSDHLRCRDCYYDTFSKVLDVLSEWMLKRKELMMFVEGQILATLL